MSHGDGVSHHLADFCAGWIAGCAGIVVSHPFDTIKVRLQTQGVNPKVTQKYNGTFHCLYETVKKEKVRGLFKGMTPPLLGTAAWNAVVFGLYGNTMRFLTQGQHSQEHNLMFVAISSLTVAMAQSVVICPMELVKSRLQIQSNAETRVYKGPIDCVDKIYKYEGFKGLFRGMNSTIIRDIPGFTSYFCSYEILTRILSGKEQSHLGPLALMLAGGTAGTISWAVAFPYDVIKTRIQVDHANEYKGFIHCLRKSYKTEGRQLFIRGLAPTLMRAFPMNAAIFSVYTLLMRMFHNRPIYSQVDPVEI